MTTYAHTGTSWRCDACGADMGTPLFCDACGADYPERRGFSPFAVLGLPVRFDLGGADLDRLEVDLTRRLHPDVWVARGPRQQARALIAQSAVNDAIAALRGPFERAETLLGLLDASEPGARPPLPQGFLIEQLELQERLMDGIDDAERKELRRRIRTELAALRDRLASLLGAEPDPERLAEAREALDRSRYWRNLERVVRGPA